LRTWFGLASLSSPLPSTAGAAEDVLLAAVRPWQRVNERIKIESGPDYLIGHGILIRDGQAVPTDVPAATAYVRDGWKRIERHVDEIFYDQVEAIADVLRVSAVPAGSHPYQISRETFAEVERPVLVRDGVVEDDDQLYRLLRTIAETNGGQDGPPAHRAH
jgi:hypothetical protein